MKLFIYTSYIVHTIFQSIWFFCDFISNTYHFVFMYNCNLFQMKFASDSYAFQIVLTQNYQDFLHQSSHQLFSTVLQCFWQRLPTFESNMICTVIPTTLPHFSYTGYGTWLKDISQSDLSWMSIYLFIYDSIS